MWGTRLAQRDDYIRIMFLINSLQLFKGSLQLDFDLIFLIQCERSSFLCLYHQLTGINEASEPCMNLNII